MILLLIIKRFSLLLTLDSLDRQRCFFLFFLISVLADLIVKLIVEHYFLCFRAFITALANGNTIRVFKVNKKKDGSGTSITGEFDFPVKHSVEIINIAVASSGKFIMSCSRDTTIILWNLKGMP